MRQSSPTKPSDWVNRIIPIKPGPAQAVPRPYEHQNKALAVLDGPSLSVTPPVSGIVFLPTGSGKTRIGIEHMARVLRVEPEHRFIWATYSRALIQQTLQRLQDYGPLFAGTTNALWMDGNFDDHDFDEAQILFMTRARLTAELDFATNLRLSAHPLRDRILEKRPTTLIYDECHQLEIGRAHV